jgi:excisionase family DNA binding protein
MAKTDLKKLAAQFAKLLTVAQAAEIKGVPPRTIRWWCSTGHLPSIQDGSEYRIAASDLRKVQRPKRGPKSA